MTDEKAVLERSPGEIEANEAKLRAEAAKAEAEAEVQKLKAMQETISLESSERTNRKNREAEEKRLVSDDKKRVYRFIGGVDKSSANKAIATLIEWHRLDPGCDITILFHSPGGGIIEGFALFDTILFLRNEGHHVTTIAEGMAASMAGILLQAGDTRVMSPQSALLIHEAQFGAIGSYGKVSDQVEFVEKLQERILDIFADRSEMSRDEIKDKWERRDWWLMADEALEAGFVDEIR